MKKLLFITEPFYQISDLIRNTIEEDGNYTVDYLQVINGSITDLSKKRYGNHFFNRFNSKEIIDENRRKQSAFFEAHANTAYDMILLIVFSGLCVDLFKEFAQCHKESKIIMYLWDAVERISFFNDIKEVLNRVVSYDHLDCKRCGFDFLPLFFSKEYMYSGEKKDYDIFTYGVLNDDRERVIKKIIADFPISDYKWEAKLIMKRKEFIKDIIRKKRGLSKPFYISFKGITAKEAAYVLKRSNVVVDIAAPGQNGLTMRTFEALAAKAKIITTNLNIRNYDFYNINNVEIIDRYNPQIRSDFIRLPYQSVDASIVEKYTIKNWVKKLLVENDRL